MKILFVCLGNICRSPMAEFILKDLIAKSGLKGHYSVSSAATSDEVIGDPVYPPAAETLSAHGLDCSGKTAVQFQRKDYGEYDLIVAMERSNVRQLIKTIGSDPYEKIRLLLSFAGDPGDIADPWYTRDFEKAYREIYKGCEGIIRLLKKREKGK